MVAEDIRTFPFQWMETQNLTSVSRYMCRVSEVGETPMFMVRSWKQEKVVLACVASNSPG